MKPSIHAIIEQIILKKAFIKDYPKPNVTFLTLDRLFNDPHSRSLITKAVLSATHDIPFDDVASIASRGYIFSGIITNHLHEKGENFIQKPKKMGDPRFKQLSTKTEYSNDALQVLKNTIQKGKKYLITDDLVATGGSIKTAIELIRSCGGQVDKAFVMTELLDFGAREALKQMGVELISLLKFTQEDCHKMLQIQAAYDGDPTRPMSYKFSHYERGVDDLIASNDSPALAVHLASESPIKTESTQLAFQSMFDPLKILVIPHDSPSGVSPQPFGDNETILGAINRLQSVKNNAMDDDNASFVSMENGIRYVEKDKSYYDFVHIVVKKGDMTFNHTQNCCKIPNEVIDAMHKDQNENLMETWGQTAYRLGLAKAPKNPHQEKHFGGISRHDHLFKALCTALGQIKEKMLPKHAAQLPEETFHVNRLVTFNDKKSKDKYAKRGIRFTTKKKVIHARAIDLYNQGCPLQAWNIDPKVTQQNQFKVFLTGDAFSTLSPDIDIEGSHINIHVGIKHDVLSRSVLIHEALQMIRCAYEHGAKSITIALPEQFHPVANHNDFNVLLMKLFKVSGASRIYFYNDNYTGKLDEHHMSERMPLSMRNLSEKQINYMNSLKQSSTKNSSNFDDKIKQFIRKHVFSRTWSKFDPEDHDILTYLGADEAKLSLNIPKAKGLPHVVLACSANKALAEKITKSLESQGEKVKLYHIEGQGQNATIPDDATLCGAKVTIVQSTRPNPDDIEKIKQYETNGASDNLFEAAAIARQAYLRGADNISLINPYQFGARSDKAENNFKGKAGAYVQHNGMLLEASGINHIVTAECHDTHTLSGAYTRTKMTGSTISALATMSSTFANEWLSNTNHAMQGQLRLVAPDAGAEKRTKELKQQLQSMLGKKLCEKRVIGVKERDSHLDTSALINHLNTGDVAINPHDKYLITDDETATGGTLCQAIRNLKKNGAQDIGVIVVHNNMPLDWLQRQLCLARFLYMGVNDLRFSDTNEMSTLAKNYSHLIEFYSQKAKLPKEAVEEKVLMWFKQNIASISSLTQGEDIDSQLAQFKSMFDQFHSKIKIHSLANDFAKKVISSPHKILTNHLESKNEIKPIDELRSQKAPLVFSQRQLSRRIKQTEPEHHSQTQISRLSISC